MITVLVLVGQVLELRAAAETGHAIRRLLDLKHRRRRVSSRNEEEQEVPLAK